MNKPGGVTWSEQRANYGILITFSALRIADFVKRKEKCKQGTDYFYVHILNSEKWMFIIPTYAQPSGVKININITPTCFAVNTPSSDS